VSPLGPGSRARTDIVRKIGAEARAWPGHENLAAYFILTISQQSLSRSRGAFLRPGFALSLFQPPP
jgi:hypothetical protein